MNRIICFLFVIVVAGVLARISTAKPGIDPRIDDRMIVHIAAESDLATFIAMFEKNNPTVTLEELESIPGREIYLLQVNLPAGYTPEFMDQLEQDLKTNYEGILYEGDPCTPCGPGESGVSGDFLYLNEAPEGKSGSTWLSGIAPESFTAQYSLPLIGSAIAHVRSTGLGTAIALLDTGIDATHPQLAGRVLPNGYDFIDEDSDPQDEGDDVDNDEDGDIDEAAGHGTFVAGLLTLVAPDARILPVRILNSDGVGDEWLLVKGLYFAIDRGVEVINLSLGSTYDTVAVKVAIAEAATYGIVVVAAAGNFNRSEPREHPAMGDVWVWELPGEVTGAFGVAATDPDDVKAEFSNYNKRLVLSAPGDIASGPFDPEFAIISIFPDGDYAAWEGTSFATAFVSATAALVRSQHPEWAADLDTYFQIEAILTGTAVDIYPQNPEFEPDEELGAGRLDTAAAVAVGPIAPAKLGDLDNNGAVDILDLLALLEEWGAVHSSADLDGNGAVDILDLLLLLANWG